MRRVKIAAVCVVAASVIVLAVLFRDVLTSTMLELGSLLQDLTSKPAGRALGVVLTAAIAFVFYKISWGALRGALRRSGMGPKDIAMIGNFWRFTVGFLALLVILSVFLELGVVAAVFGAFGGMFLGWALQAPISGFAAWILINLQRPFRIGDRIMVPAWGLVGDVIDVNPMYTILEQVGGTVGTEEPVGRHILIPNAVLFSTLIINYTPPHQRRRTLEVSEKTKGESDAYILDEIVVRITYDSDWDEAERILVDAASEVTADIIKATGVKPYVRADFYDYGVYLRLRYMTLATDRPRIAHEITKRIFKEFARNDKVDFAIPFTYSYRAGVRSKIGVDGFRPNPPTPPEASEQSKGAEDGGREGSVGIGNPSSKETKE